MTRHKECGGEMKGMVCTLCRKKLNWWEYFTQTVEAKDPEQGLPSNPQEYKRMLREGRHLKRK